MTASASRLNSQLKRAFDCIYARQCGAEGELTVEGHTFGFGKVANKWSMYYIRDGERAYISEAPLVVRAAMANNLMDLWHAVQTAHEAKERWVIEAADNASKFCDYMDEPDD